MQTKIIEIRDRATYLPVLATKMASDDEMENFHLEHTGYGGDFPLILIVTMEPPIRCGYDPFSWTNRTFHEAHLYIAAHYDEIPNGGVVDVEYILGEKNEPKNSQRLR